MKPLTSGGYRAKVRRRLLVMETVTLVVLGLSISVLHGQLRKLVQVSASVVELRDKLNRSRALSHSRTTLEQRLQEDRKQLSGLRVDVPSGRFMGEVIADLERLASQCRTEVVALVPGREGEAQATAATGTEAKETDKASAPGGAKAVPVTVTLTGTFQNHFDLVKKLQEFPKIAFIGGLSMKVTGTPKTGETPRVQARLTLVAYVFPTEGRNEDGQAQAGAANSGGAGGRGTGPGVGPLAPAGSQRLGQPPLAQPAGGTTRQRAGTFRLQGDVRPPATTPVGAAARGGASDSQSLAPSRETGAGRRH